MSTGAQPPVVPTSAGAAGVSQTTNVTTTTTTTTKSKTKKTPGAGAGAGVGGKKAAPNSHHNTPLGAQGLMRFSRGRMFHRRALWRITKWKSDRQAKRTEDSKLRQKKRAEKKGTLQTPASIKKKKTTSRSLMKGGKDTRLRRKKRSTTTTEAATGATGTTKKPKRATFEKKPIGGDRNGKERLVRSKRFPRYYPTEDRPKKFRVKRKMFKDHPRHFRPSLMPGTIVIMVAGRHAGKRAVIVKHLSSGLLLLTGPHKLNGVGLRRMNQIYVIATSTKIDLPQGKFEHLTDKFLKRVRAPKKDAENDIFDSKKKPKGQLSDERKQAQKDVDAAILQSIKAHADSRLLRRYLKSRFQLFNGVLPHKIKF